MLNQTSVLEDLLLASPQLRPQIYFKPSLTALSHAMEDQVLASAEKPLVIASFQRERFYRQEAHRYLRIAERTNQVYILAAPETDFTNSSQIYETIAFDPTDRLSEEWHLVVISDNYTSCLICQEKKQPSHSKNQLPAMDQSRRFEGVWTFDRCVSCQAAELILQRILQYRPELREKINQARQLLNLEGRPPFPQTDPGPFTQRLVTYLQAGQHKLLKTYRSLANQEQKERMINLITSAIRQSLDPTEIFQVAARELGQALDSCRCLIYKCKSRDEFATIEHEYLAPAIPSLVGKKWPLQQNPLFQEVIQKKERVYVEYAPTESRFTGTPLETLLQQQQIGSWLMVPLLYQNQIVGIIELHYCAGTPSSWEEPELNLVDAIAGQVGIALIQAEAYAHLVALNEQLEALESARSNLIAITGHELRTPLSTIQVCLETLASDPDMPLELRTIMLNSALSDAERLRKLVQDFLTLSRLESGRVQWHPEPLDIQECIDLALSSLRFQEGHQQAIKISPQIPQDLPFVQADGEWLVEVLAKLLDNACKFTANPGEIVIKTQQSNSKEIEVIIADTGRGIPIDRLDTVFDRFYQEEGALRRTQGGTGLGLAICRQIVSGWGGQIWATSAGKDQGSQFHFTVPVADTSPIPKIVPTRTPKNSKRSQAGRKK